KKTLSLKGAPNLGNRPNMARSSRTVVVEKRTRFVPPGPPGSHTPHPPHGNAQASRPQQGSAPAQSSGRPAQSAPPQGGRPQYDSRSNQSRPPQRRGSGAARPGGGLSAPESDARARALREAASRQAEEDARARA